MTTLYERMSYQPCGLTGQTPPSFPAIVDVTGGFLGVHPAEIAGRSRRSRISYARNMVMFLARKMTLLSLEEIGLLLGGRNHSTVIHGVRAIALEIDANDDLTKRRVQWLTGALRPLEPPKSP